jgi:release factor glutamine methyltransferase
VTAGDALLQAIDLLTTGAVPEPRLTAEVLLGHALHKNRTWLYAHPEHILSELEWLHFGRYLHERIQGRPTQYITKTQEWYGRPFLVTPAVLIPRPETEHVIERALELSPRPQRILDIGTGSGAIAITLALELRAEVFATDLSLEALLVARENAGRLDARVEFVNCDLAAAIQGSFDLVVSNPPYVPDDEIPGLQREVRDHEPHLALNGGDQGLELYRRIIPQAELLLNPGGALLFEMGYRSEPGIRAALGPGWSDVKTGYDLAGLPRVLCAKRASSVSVLR